MEKALIIKPLWLDKIFDEGKIFEMRSTPTKIRGLILLIASGSGNIVGTAELVDCFELPKEQQDRTKEFHKVEDLALLDKWRFAWVLKNAKRYEKPLPYNHPKGAVIWVNLKLK
jgi:hypothetical protein